jgi:hypothetical protein
MALRLRSTTLVTENMSDIVRKNFNIQSAYLGAAAGLCAVAVLGGCVVRVAAPPPPPPPPPPRVYVAPQPPPPPEYVASAGDSDEQASEAPPPLPDYDQPPCPVDGYLWTPGYWRWGGGAGYYWVPGTWVQPPQVGVLWTPGYWGFVGNVYVFHAGYWGPHVGFYGGVNYGYGYGGVGFVGGHWAGGGFAYNTTVVHVNTVVIHNTYNQTVVNNVTINKVSYNGGAGGVVAAPTAQERIAVRENHFPPTQLQQQHIQEAGRNPALAARANGGHPTIAATARPAAFSGPGVVGAHGAQPFNGNHMPPANANHAPAPGTARPQGLNPRPAVAQGQPGRPPQGQPGKPPQGKAPPPKKRGNEPDKDHNKP